MAPSSNLQIPEAVRLAFREEPRLGPTFNLARVAVEPDGALLLEGTVATLAQKKLALARAAAIPGVTDLVDRVHVAAEKGARHLRAQLCERLASDLIFAGFEVRQDIAGGILETDFEPAAGATDTGRRIDVEVNDGVVTLNGTVPSLVHQRLAGIIAWRVPGVRDVVNGIVVEPPEEDGPDQMEEAVRAALDGNQMVDSSQIRVGVRGNAVRLTGLVPSHDMRDLAEQDAWAVLGVDDVINEIAVRS